MRQNEIVNLSPDEAQKLVNDGYVLNWLDKTKHARGEPKTRKYLVLGQWNRRKK